MFDFSWAELALIAAVALVVIGPKDLPRALRTAGMWARKARTISREFQSSIEQMVREAELDEVKKELQAATSLNLESEIKKTVDPDGSLSTAATPAEPVHSIAAPAPVPETPVPETPMPETPMPGTPMPGTPSAEAPPQAAAPETTPALPDPERVPAASSSPSPEPQPRADASHATPAPSHSGGAP
jgi:sec-independent protein translocase protein TatB